MKKKHIEFLLKFHKRSRHLYTLRNCGVIHNSKLTGDNYGNKFLHLVNSDDCGDSIFLDFDRKMGKEKRCETTIPRKLIDCCKTLSNCGVILNSDFYKKHFSNFIFIFFLVICKRRKQQSRESDRRFFLSFQ